MSPTREMELHFFDKFAMRPVWSEWKAVMRDKSFFERNQDIVSRLGGRSPDARRAGRWRFGAAGIPSAPRPLPMRTSSPPAQAWPVTEDAVRQVFDGLGPASGGDAGQSAFDTWDSGPLAANRGMGGDLPTDLSLAPAKHGYSGASDWHFGQDKPGGDGAAADERLEGAGWTAPPSHAFAARPALAAGSDAITTDDLATHLVRFDFPTARAADSSAPAASTNSLPSFTDLDPEITFISGVTFGELVAGTSYNNWNGDSPATYNNTSGTYKWGSDHQAPRAGGTVHYYFDPASSWSAAEKAGFVAGCICGAQRPTYPSARAPPCPAPTSPSSAARALAPPPAFLIIQQRLARPTRHAGNGRRHHHRHQRRRVWSDHRSVHARGIRALRRLSVRYDRA